MELDYVLSWLAGASSVAGLAVNWRQHGVRLPGWLIVYVSVLGVVLVDALTDLPAVGYVAGLAWLLLVLVPLAALRRMAVALERDDWQRAVVWARLAHVLHPWDGFRGQVVHLSYQHLLRSGQREQAASLLDSLARCPGWEERARLEKLGLKHDWAAVAARVGGQPTGTRDLRIAPIYLRALGEIGDLETLFETYARLPALLRAQPAPRIMVASFSGLVSSLELLLALGGAWRRADEVSFWRAVADQRAGRFADAERRLTALAGGPSVLRHSAKLKLERPLARAAIAQGSAELQRLVEQFKAEVRAQVSSAGRFERRRWPVVTLTLVALLAIVFLLELRGGATNRENLVEMGALLLPVQLSEGTLVERVLSAGWLHYGWLHLALNALGLTIIGREVEHLLGRSGLLVVFIVSNIGTFALTAALSSPAGAAPQVVLGASAGVMGLVGALVAFSAFGYWGARQRSLGRRLVILLAVVGAQMVFDYATPIVSGRLHLMGAGLGALVALPFVRGFWLARRG